MKSPIRPDHALPDAALASARKALEKRRMTLSGEVTMHTPSTDAARQADEGDVASDLSMAEVEQAEVERDLTELRAIDAALRRLDEGTYGMCLDCGQAIEPRRLKALPTAARCTICQAAHEVQYAR